MPVPTPLSSRHRQLLTHPRRLAAGAAVLLCVLAALGCGGSKKAERPIAAAPTPTYTGPSFLRGTVGSLMSLRPGSGEPQLVSGFGIVVFPPGTGTGSSEVPAAIRQRLITRMRQQGVGSAQVRAHLGPQYAPFMSLSPGQFLDSPDTAVVAVQGLIPPGATSGTRFDLLVSALDSQTTSLAGGTLWTTDLAIEGANLNVQFSRKLAEGYGPIYINPLTEAEGTAEFKRQGVVVLGGRASAARDIELILNQPSWTRSRLIADRINERFGRATDPVPIAEPKTDLRIVLNVPDRWAAQPEVLVDLIAHLYVERSAGFEQMQARRLINVLRDEPGYERQISLAWRALGRNALEPLREFYGEGDALLQLPALEAGAWLGDERASRHLDALSSSDDPVVRVRVADALVHLPNSMQGAATLRRLLDDADTRVRIAAYESLAVINDEGILDRLGIMEDDRIKMIIDRVPAEKPLVYVTQRDVPRLVIFSPELGFRTPMLASLWDGRLMLRAQDGEPIKLFYQPPRRVEPQTGDVIEPRTHSVYPNVATLAYVLAHRSSTRDMQDGLGLGYTQVVDVIHELCEQGHIDAPIEFNLSPLAQRVEELQKQPTYRPETGDNPQNLEEGTGDRPAAPAGEGLSRSETRGGGS